MVEFKEEFQIQKQKRNELDATELQLQEAEKLWMLFCIKVKKAVPPREEKWEEKIEEWERKLLKYREEIRIERMELDERIDELVKKYLSECWS